MSGPILVFGAGGQLGREFMELARARGVQAIGLTRADVDICDEAAVAAAVARARPRLIVNAAAYTAVDKAESDIEGATRGNVAGPAALARVAAAAAPLVHFSTDYVFDGAKRGAWREDDLVAPLGVYGGTKLAGEIAVREATPRHLIVRTAWVYGVHGANFLKTMLRLAAERPELRVVADQRGCPTSTVDLAEAILAIDGALARGATPWGVYHFAGQGETSWHGFAEAIVAAQARVTGKQPPVRPIATSDYPTPAKRPANSALDSSRFSETFGFTAAPWQHRVDETVAQLLRKA